MGYKVVCTRKELSCIISNLFVELKPLCENLCADMEPDDFILAGTITGSEDSYAIIKITEYGLEYFGNVEYIERVRKARCLVHGAADTAKESRGVAK